MPKSRIAEPGLDPKVKVGRLVESLVHLDNTIQVSWLVELCRKFFVFSDDRITLANWEALYEAVAPLVGGSATRKPDVVTGVKPIKQRLFTLKIDRVPACVLMQKLEESEIVFEYDAEQLAAAGIDLDQPIKLEVEKASAADFFKAVFDPLRLTAEIDNLTVKLKPKRL